jgi:hypothetical protein
MLCLAVVLAAQTDRRGTRSLRQLAEDQKRDIFITHSIGLPVVNPVREQRTPIQIAGCQADLIVRGTVTGMRSEFTPDETSIYTRYEVTVLETLKGQANADVLTVERPGGVVKVGENTVSEQFEDWFGLRPGRDHLLLLRRAGNSKIYQGFDQFSSFEINGARVTKTTKDPRYPPIGARWLLADLLTELKIGLGKCDSPFSSRPESRT